MGRSFLCSRLGRYLAAVIGAIALFVYPVSALAESILADGKTVRVRTRPIETFRIGHDDTRFGKLTFLGGLELLASDRQVGGLSGLISLEDGNGFLAVTDNGHWVAGDVEQTTDGKPLGISNLRYAPLLGADGKTLKARWGHDTEALTLAASGLYVSAEKRNTVYRYPWPLKTGTERMKGELALPKDIRDLPLNKGLESLAAAPAGGALAGKLLAIAESAPSDLHDLSGFILGPDGTGRFRIRRHDRFDATDAAFLPDGDLLVMERRFNLMDLIGLRLRRFEAAEIKAGAVLEGELLLEADFGYQIDNMEALAVHRTEAGETILTLVSDDNRSLMQRTLFLRFRLNE
ncbi:esterase-like activity of phytase family protein [Roseibium aggregatum]|uniref:Esterase-like activity of phytase family protein n=1 Tax=Roseibium aggregatum TaxID=187304 RepID=A0A939EJ38_9HYPH|nr:esterase-like activity of phytase family protein [Roseibium aggregatum]MBN9674075.1 esterase-like activity of phytase family protein [Roseibium aggregatum]